MIFKKNVSKQEFKRLTEPHMKLLYNVALRYTGSIFDAEDIVQETCLMAFNKFHQLKDPSRCKPWLLRILRNNFLKNCQKAKSLQRLKETDYIDFLKDHVRKDDAEESLVKKSGSLLLKRAIDKLPVKYREVLILYYMDDMRYKDIASVLDIPIGTVMSRLTRARQSLKTGLLKTVKQPGENILDINFNLQKKDAQGTKKP